MAYSCSDFTDSILNALGIDVPEESHDSPSDQADLALAAIGALKVRGNVITGRHEATRTMLAALEAVAAWECGSTSDKVRDAIAAAKAAGI